MAKIEKQRKGQTWCGSAALAYLCGLTYEEAEKAILRARKQFRPWKLERSKIIRGVQTREMYPTLKRYYTIVPEPTEKMNLGKWAEWVRRPGHTYLVTVTGHYVVVTPEAIFDNQDGLVPLDHPKQQRKFVREVLRLTPRKGQAYRLGLTLSE